MAKGTVTNEIQYRGFNTVRMSPGDSYDCYEFFVKAGDYISHSFAIYSVNPLAGAVRARTRFIGVNGLTISTSSHTVATTGGTFDEIAIEGVPVPTGARLGRLELLSPSGTYWVARPKSEDGEKVTPYSQNYSGQMTHITPTGVYTGTIQANQINLTSGGDLEDSMATINSQVLNMTSSVSALNASVTNIQAGQAEFVKISDIDGSKSTTIIDGGIIKTGTITASELAANAVTAAKISSNAVTAVKISSGAITTAKLAANAVTADKISASAITADKLNVTNLSSISSNLGSITGGSINIGSGKFTVNSSGNLTATSVTVTGTVNANYGSVGPLDVSSSGLTYNGRTQVTSGGYFRGSGAGVSGTFSGDMNAGRLHVPGVPTSASGSGSSFTVNVAGTNYKVVRMLFKTPGTDQYGLGLVAIGGITPPSPPGPGNRTYEPY